MRTLSEFAKIGRVTGERPPRGGFGVASKCKACVAEARKPGIALARAEKQRRVDAGLKRCGTCTELLPREDFNHSEASTDKLCFKCRRCSALKAAEWRERNPGAFKAWHAENRQERADYWREWYEANKAHRSESYAKWAKENKHIVNALIAKRTAAKFNATATWADLDAIRAMYAEASRLTEETGIKHEVDHFYPLQGKSVCGLHCEANLQILTKVENIRKANRMPEEIHEASRNFSSGSRHGACAA